MTRGGLSIDQFENRFEAGCRYSVWSGSRCIACGLFGGDAYRELSFDAREPKDVQSFPSTSLWSEQPSSRRDLFSYDHRVDLPSFSYLLPCREEMGGEESARLSVKDPE